MLKTSLLILLLLIAAFLGYAANQPSQFRVERSIVIDAPASAVFPHVNALYRWESWSPWAKLDPNAANGYDGPEEGVGASVRWKGNMEVGEGKMTITESVRDETVALSLEFLKPMESTSTARFTFTPEGEGRTHVTWVMEGHNNFISKVIGLVMNCEKMVGEQFEQGLANLKATVEG